MHDWFIDTDVPSSFCRLCIFWLHNCWISDVSPKHIRTKSINIFELWRVQSENKSLVCYFKSRLPSQKLMATVILGGEKFRSSSHFRRNELKSIVQTRPIDSSVFLGSTTNHLLQLPNWTNFCFTFCFARRWKFAKSLFLRSKISNLIHQNQCVYNCSFRFWDIFWTFSSFNNKLLCFKRMCKQPSQKLHIYRT